MTYLLSFLNPKYDEVELDVLQFASMMDVIAIFESISEAVKTTGTNSKSIRDCCNGIQKHAGGFVWKYLDNDKTN